MSRTLLLLALGVVQAVTGDGGGDLGEEEEEEGAGLPVSVDSAKREMCTVISGVLPPHCPSSSNAAIGDAMSVPLLHPVQPPNICLPWETLSPG